MAAALTKLDDSGNMFKKDGWEDVQPISQDEGENPVCKISYAKEFMQLMDIFRAVIRSGEKSARVLELTREILDHNAANYTVWQLRRECLRESFRPVAKKQVHDEGEVMVESGASSGLIISSSIDSGKSSTGHSDSKSGFSGGVDVLFDELDFMDSFARDNPKNYQIWYHRRAVVEMILSIEGVAADGERELEFCSEVFEVDAKNYHAWAHRQWVLLTFHLWSDEIQSIESLLTKDVRNNSAWNQRWFVVHSGPQGVDASILQREVEFTISALEKVVENESAWNYLRGLTRHHRGDVSKRIIEWCSDTLPMQPKNAFLHCLLADLLEEEGSCESLQRARTLFQNLSILDPIRAKAWKRKCLQFEKE